MSSLESQIHHFEHIVCTVLSLPPSSRTQAPHFLYHMPCKYHTLEMTLMFSQAPRGQWLIASPVSFCLLLPPPLLTSQATSDHE